MKLTQAIGHTMLFGRAGPVHGDHRSDRPYLRFAQVSDLHFTLNEGVGGREALSPCIVELLVDHLNTLDLDFILFTGDLIHLPRLIGTDLTALAGRLEALRAPWYPVVGNHDIAGQHTAEARAVWLRTFAGRIGNSRSTWYTVQARPDIRLLMLDTTDHEGGPYTWTQGYVGNQQMEWLRAELVQRPDQHVILVMHHPIERPLPIEHLSMIPEHRRRLHAMVNRFSQVRLILTGHFHVARIQQVGSAHQVACPGLIEYPHAFRIFSLRQTPAAGYWCDLEWQRLEGIDPADTAGPGLFGGLVRPLVVAGRRGARLRRFRVQLPT